MAALPQELQRRRDLLLWLEQLLTRVGGMTTSELELIADCLHMGGGVQQCFFW